MKKYTDARTEFVKRHIRALSYEKYHRAIDDLLTIEEFIINGVQSYWEAVHFSKLKSKYPNHYRGILRELDPEKFKEEELEHILDEADWHITKRKISALRDKMKRNWLKAGGKL